MENIVKKFLQSKHIIVPNDWTEQCIQFVQEEFRNEVHGNTEALKKKIFEQWLHCDFTELGSSCLPVNILQQKANSITGMFNLQINEIRDIGTSSYSQLQRIRQMDTANSKISDDKPSQAAWEPKQKRMLWMKLTDGLNFVQAMEYELIPTLSLLLKPGTKILVSGTVEIRRGVLFLKKSNVEILGGEVDSLLISSAQENILCRTLNMPETKNPVKLNEKLIESTQVAPSQPSQYYPSMNSHSQGISQYAKKLVRQPIKKPKIEATDIFDDFIDEDIEKEMLKLENQYMLNQDNTSNGTNSFNQSDPVEELMMTLPDPHEFDAFQHNSKLVETKPTVNVKSIVTTRPPFNYLCFLPDKPSGQVRFVIKGFVMTLTSRLTENNGKHRLLVCLNDGTGSCEARLDDQIIQNMLGWTAKELSEKIAASKSNPAIKSENSKTLQAFQKNLISMSCIFHLESQLEPDFWTIVKVVPLTPGHQTQLKNRLSRLK